MKINDIVTLKNLDAKYNKHNLYKNVNGIVLKVLPYNKSLILFLNDKIIGDYAVVEVDNYDLKIEKEILPMNFTSELENLKKLNEEKLLKKQSFEKLSFNECDYVEMIVEEERYAKQGIHKGDRGVVAIDYAVNNSILVDFSGIDKEGNYYGDCISVKVGDIKLINK